jgi:hypothetical protein
MSSLTLVLAFVLVGCATQPLQQLPPSAYEPVSESTRCIERCRIQHEACIQNLLQLCSMPCSQRFIGCRLGCAPMSMPGQTFTSPWGADPRRWQRDAPFDPWRTL